jgi:hypothetical protein
MREINVREIEKKKKAPRRKELFLKQPMNKQRTIIK